MLTTPSQVAEIQKGQVDAMYALSHAVFGATEKLADLNLAAAKALMDESAEKAQALLRLKDVPEFVAMSGSLVQPTVEKIVSYSRNIYSIASGTGTEVSKIVEVQIADGGKRVVDFVEVAARNAPAGSEPAVSMIKSAVAAANGAYDTLSKAAKQAVDLAESNFSAAAQASLKAASAAGEAVKTKGRKSA